MFTFHALVQLLGSGYWSGQTCICHFCTIPSPAQFFERTTFTNRDLTVLSHKELAKMPLPWPGSSEPCQFPLKSLESNWCQSHANTAITYNVWLKIGIYAVRGVLAKTPDSGCPTEWWPPGLWTSNGRDKRVDECRT
jgi:hypothetical protein